jgi:hypothetical protein
MMSGDDAFYGYLTKRACKLLVMYAEGSMRGGGKLVDTKWIGHISRRPMLRMSAV